MSALVRHRRLAIAAVAAVVVPTAVLTPQLTAGATTGGPGIWVQLSSGTGVGNIDDPGVARFGSTLQVVWTQKSGTNEVLHTRILSSNGSTASGDVAALPAWAALNEFPALISNAGQRVLVFSGLQDTNTSNPYSAGSMYYATSTDGLTWTLASGSLSQSQYAYSSYGSDAVDANGTPIAAFTAATAGKITFHTGFDSSIPAAAADSSTTDAGCCAYYTSAAYDASGGKAWVVWYSNSSTQSQSGIEAQQIYPTVGSLLHAPKSTTLYNGTYQSVSPIQRVQTAARAGGGVWTAYPVGYPSPTRIGLWHVGSSTAPLVISTGHSVAQIGVAPGPKGKIWVFWWTRGTSTLHAVRTNGAVTRLGKTCNVRTPHGSTTVWKTAGNGTNGRLDLVTSATVNGAIQMYSTQVLPCLSGAVSPTSVKSSTGGTITVYVKDAGAPVAGSYVRYAGITKKTGTLGKVTFAVAKGTAKGLKRVTFKHAGYTGGSVTFRVT